MVGLFPVDGVHLHVLVERPGLLSLHLDPVGPLDRRVRAHGDVGGDALGDALAKSARSLDQVIDRVGGNPDHGGEADHEAKSLAPSGVFVGLCVTDRGVLDEVEQEDEL